MPAVPGDRPVRKRVAISGCGAVTRLYYARALSELAAGGAVAVAAVFDPDQQAARGVAAGFAGAAALDSFELLLAERPDLVFVASPPGVHEEQVTACLQRGADVLCEKPLCLSGDAARRMQATADRAGRNLWVGLVRRQFPATQAVRDLVASGALGRIEDVQIFEGGPFRWPIRSQLYFSREISGGGVFQDLGAHAVDLLTWWFGQPLDLDYEDDVSGGVEANCRLVLRYAGFEAVLRLSRDWARPNRYVVRGSLGTIAWSVDEPDRVELVYKGRASSMDLVARTGTSDRHGRPQRADFHSCFVAQIAAAAGHSDTTALVSVREAVPGIEIIEQAYRRRRPLPQPWMGEAMARGAAL